MARRAVAPDRGAGLGLADRSKERVVDKQKIREMKPATGVCYLDFTPVMIVALASVVGARDLAIGTGDTELYIFAGMLAAVVISIWVFRGAGRAAGPQTGLPVIVPGPR